MDLHIHTVYSDGELTPGDILHEADGRGVSLLSFTDHDEIAGYLEGEALARQLGIALVPGIELNTDGPDGVLHILGYQFDPRSQVLTDHINWRKEERMHWAGKIVERLNELGFEIGLEDCLRQATGDVIVRTHIAEALCEKGYFKSSKAAFERLLQKNRPGYVNRAAFTAQEAINLIHDAGGSSFLAHPGIYPFKPDIARLASYGLDGIEVYHSKHTEGQERFWRSQAELFQLAVSGGTDHHGPDSRNPYPIGSVRIDAPCRHYWLDRMGVLL